MSLLLSGGCFSGLKEGCKGDRPACSSEVEQRAVVYVICWILSHRLKNSCRRLLWNPSLCGLFTMWIETSGGRMKHFLFFFSSSYTVQRPGHCALPGYLPHRPHHAGHGGQRQAGCKFLSSLSGGKLVATPWKLQSILQLSNWRNTSCRSLCRTATSTLTKGEGWVLKG